MGLISEAEVAEDRAMAEAEMTDTCIVRNPVPDGTPKPPIDESTGQYPTQTGPIVYGPGAVDPATGQPSTDPDVLAGKFRLQVRSDINSNAVEAVVAEHEFTYRTATAQLPVIASRHILTDATLEILTCPLDPSMEGRVLNLQADTKGKTQASCRRFRTREVI